MFVDFAKAFDVISHDLLLRKVTHNGLSANTLSLINSFLSNRLQKISLKDKQSNFKTVLLGVPQGSGLGPLLFAIYINDLPLHIPSAQCDTLAHNTTIHTSGLDIPATTSVLQSCLSDIVECYMLQPLENEVHDTSHESEASTASLTIRIPFR